MQRGKIEGPASSGLVPALCLLVVLLASIYCAAQIRGEVTPFGRHQHRLVGFSFTAGICPQEWESAGYCTVREPKGWSRAEMDLVAMTAVERPGDAFAEIGAYLS